jgi:cytochrome c553
MRVRLRTLGYGLAGLALAGAAVFWFGWIHIGASTGHWAITDWFLHTAMRRSVKFHSADAEVPPELDHPALIRRGAGHYETGCAPCHGSPARPRGPVPREMTPEPPGLAGRIDEWEPRHLYWIVKHGVKFTGMPAWPALSRDDEAWAVAAFLLAMPEMTAEEYQRLAYGEAWEELPAPGALSLAASPALADCRRCHGDDGLGPANGAFPRLDIQSEEYLLTALVAFRDGARASGIMQPAAAGLSDADLADLAEHYARPAPLAPAALDASEVDPELLARGESIARHGIPEDGVGACLGCHGAPHRPAFPRLDGQYPGYLAIQLALFATETRRGGAEFAHLMETATHQLEPEHIDAVAAYFASRDPAATAAESRLR